MKQIITIASLVLAAIIITTTSCKKKEGNVVTDYKSMTDALQDGFPLSEFKTADSAKKQHLIDYYRPMLVENVRRHLGDCVTPDHIHFWFGSGHADSVQDGDGKLNKGHFENELIIHVDSAKDCNHGNWFLACGNGMLGSFNFNTPMHDFGDGCTVTIDTNQGLATYWPILQKWAQNAEHLKVPIFNASGQQVSADVFTNELGHYQSVLWPGDRLNVCNGTATDVHGKAIDFGARLRATDNWRKAHGMRPASKQGQKAELQSRKKHSQKHKSTRGRG